MLNFPSTELIVSNTMEAAKAGEREAYSDIKARGATWAKDSNLYFGGSIPGFGHLVFFKSYRCAVDSYLRGMQE